MIDIVKCGVSHIADLCANLREREAEAFASLGASPNVMLRTEVERSIYAFAVLHQGHVAAVFGASTMPLSRDAYIWVVCSQRCEKHPVTFLRGSRKVFDFLLDRFESVNGLVKCDFVASVRWLEWLGCSLKPLTPEVFAFRRSR